MNFKNHQWIVWLFSLALVVCQASLADAQTCERPRAGIGRPKIVGGLLADIRDWPWQVALRVRSATDGSPFYFCGATIIDPTTVLTAAHCVADLKHVADGWVDSDGSLVEAVIGLADLKQATADHVRTVSNVKLHETYEQAYSQYKEQTAQTVGNDIALLTLSAPWKGPYAHLSLDRQSDPTNPPGSLLAVAGFGLQVASKLGGKSIAYKQADGMPFAAGSDRLQEVGVDLISDMRCLSQLKRSSLPTGQLCAGSEFGGHDSCSGDSGGPLVTFDTGGCTYQIGIVSSGPADCAQARAYGFYTRVSDFADWIRRNVPDAVAATGSAAAASTDNVASADAIDTAQAQLAEVAGSPSDLATVSVKEGSHLKVGSTLTLQVNSKIAGTLVLVDIDPAGEVTQIYPEQIQPSEQHQSRRDAGARRRGSGLCVSCYRARRARPRGCPRWACVARPCGIDRWRDAQQRYWRRGGARRLPEPTHSVDRTCAARPRGRASAMGLRHGRLRYQPLGPRRLALSANACPC